jgi:EAL and modified HD-GYP domain-containing signal transduction protein
MRLTQAEAPVGKIEETLKRDATISFRLLRYINSAGFGLSCEIQSFRHAVTILGYQNLGRWLALLLASAGSTPAAPALMREAIVRARLGELIGLDLFEPHDRDNLFIVGVFSLLPPILQVPMPALLDQLNLAESLSDALLNRAGLYGPVLRLVEAVEGRDADDIHALALSLNLSAEQLNAHHLEALSWADRVTL